MIVLAKIESSFLQFGIQFLPTHCTCLGVTGRWFGACLSSLPYTKAKVATTFLGQVHRQHSLGREVPSISIDAAYHFTCLPNTDPITHEPDAIHVKLADLQQTSIFNLSHPQRRPPSLPHTNQFPRCFPLFPSCTGVAASITSVCGSQLSGLDCTLSYSARMVADTRFDTF